MKLGQYTEARVDCEAVLLVHAHSLKALYRGALVCHKLHDYHVAMCYLLRAAALAPTVLPRLPSQNKLQNRLPKIRMSSLKSDTAPLNVRLSEQRSNCRARPSPIRPHGCCM